MALLSSRISDKKMVPLCRQLAQTQAAGIPILRTLQLVASTEKDRKVRDLFVRMHDRIRGGGTLEEATRAESRYLPPIFVELLTSGEAGGRIEVMLRDLAEYYEDRLQMRRTVIRKMTYPILQLALAWFLGSFALRLVRRLGAGVNLWEYFVDYARFQVIAMGVFLTAAVTFVLLMRSGVLRKPWGYVLTYAWPLNKVTQRFARARFLRSLALLIGSGAPIQRAIERSTTTMLNPIMERDLLTAVDRVKQGYTLAESFRPCKFMTPQVMEMLYVGEESGKHEEALLKASQYQQEEAAQAVSVAARVGEVLLILAVAIVVGYIVVTFYSNLYGGMLDDLGI